MGEYSRGVVDGRPEVLGVRRGATHRPDQHEDLDRKSDDHQVDGDQPDETESQCLPLAAPRLGDRAVNHASDCRCASGAAPDSRTRRSRPATGGGRPTLLSMATTEDRGAVDAFGAWQERFRKTPERSDELTSTISGIDVEPLYGPDNVELDDRELGYPGSFPFTRGVYP